MVSTCTISLLLQFWDMVSTRYLHIIYMFFQSLLEKIFHLSLLEKPMEWLYVTKTMILSISVLLWSQVWAPSVEEDSSPPARYGFLKLVHDLSSRNSSRAFGVCTTRHRSIETTLLGLLPMPLSSVSPTRASKPTRLSSGTLFYLLCSFLVLYRTWPLIKGLAFPLSSIVTGWLCPPIVSMNRFLNFPSLRNELSSYLIPKQDSR